MKSFPMYPKQHIEYKILKDSEDMSNFVDFLP